VLRVVVSRRWLTALAVAAIFAVACIYLGRWQWHRHEDKAARAERINSHYLASPVPLHRAMPSAGANLPLAEEWTPVSVTGRYAAQSLMLVRNRPNKGVFGYEVVVPLDLGDGTSVLVDRGWVPNGRTASDAPAVPATPSGDVSVTGWLRMGERSLARQMPAGQLASINLADARAQASTPLYGAYLIMRSEVGPPGERILRPQELERPDTDEGPHLAYALQWWFAAPVGIVLVLVGARREHLEGTPPARPAGDGATVALTRPTARKTRIWDEEDE